MSSVLDKLKALAPKVDEKPVQKVTLLERLGRTSVAVPEHLLINPEPARNALGRAAVEYSRDLQRVLELPRRTVNLRDTSAAKKWTAILGSQDSVPCSCYQQYGFCIKELLPLQGLGLEEASQVGGLLGLLAVGTGKCLTGSTVIFDARYGRRTIAEAAAYGRELSVPSHTSEGIRNKPATAFQSGRKQCVRLVLTDGSRVEASLDHPILTPMGWRPAGDLVEGSFVGVARVLPEPTKTLLISDEEVSLLGLLLADGNFTKNEATCAEFMRCAAIVCSGFSEQRSRTRAREFSPLGAQDFAKRWGLAGLSKYKQAPAALWRLSNRQIVLFLSRFWACDGHIGRTTAECTLASESLLDDIRFLLRRLGVRGRKAYKVATCGGKNFDAWRLVIYGRDLLRFLTLVKPIGCEERHRECLSRLQATKRNPNNDVVPIGYDEMLEVARSLSEDPTISRRQVMRFSGATRGQYLSAQKFSAVCDRFGYFGKYAQECLRPDVAWERVKSRQDLGEQPVFDLTVPETHNFVTDGVVVHNTGLDILLPMVVPDCKVALLLIPPNLKAQFLQRDFPQWSRHFNVPNLAGGRFFRAGFPVLHVVAYSELSSAKSTDLFKSIAPDLVICDEAHMVRNRTAARTKRFIRHFAAFPKTRFVGLSGTLTSRSLKDYAHLAELALGEGSPLPLHWPTVEEWAGAIDAERANTLASPMGALSKLCEPGEHVRDGFRRRLIQTPGVIASEQAEVGCSLVLSVRNVALPKSVEDALAHVRLTWQRPDGEELTDALTKAAVCKQLASGFFYRWVWPRGESKEVIKAWLEARRNWHSELREKLKTSREYLDSPLLLTKAAIRWHDGFTEIVPGARDHVHTKGCYTFEETRDGWEEKLTCDLPEHGARVEHPPHTRHRLTWAAQSWLEWKAVKDSAEPQTEAVWIDEYLLHDAIKWAFEKPGLVWYDHAAFGERLAALSKLPFFGPGTKASEAIMLEKGRRSVIVSVKAHGTGKNLQTWNRNLICNPSLGGKEWEQLLGRTHRPGQRADEVSADLYMHTPELHDSWKQAESDAKYIAQSTGVKQKLLYATRTW